MGVIRMKWAAAAVLALGLQASPAAADIYADDLTRCLVRSTKVEDRVAFTRWMFAAMSANPAVADMSTVTPAQRTEANRQSALLIQRLLLDDCRSEAINALKYEGEATLQVAFETVGRVAMGDLMSHPDVAAQINGLNAFMDVDRWTEFNAEIARPGAAAPLP